MGCDWHCSYGLWCSGLDFFYCCCRNFLLMLLQTKGNAQKVFYLLSQHRIEWNEINFSLLSFYIFQSRSVEVRYMSAAVPVDSVGLLNQSDPSALPQPVVYVLPSAPPPSYSPTTSAPPAYYSRVSTEPPTDCNSVPTSPPPPYDQVIMKNYKSSEQF